MTDPISNERLLPCPFCGLAPGINHPPGSYVEITCVHPVGDGPDGFDDGAVEATVRADTHEQAVAAWNRRQSPAGVEVKGLEWVEVNGAAGVWWRANTPLGGLPLEAMSASERVRKEADYERRILSALSVKEPEGVAYEAQYNGEGYSFTGNASPPPKAVTISDEMRQAIRVLKLIADGYPAKGDGLGEFVQVENPDYRPDNGSDPYIVVDIAALSSEPHNGREVE